MALIITDHVHTVKATMVLMATMNKSPIPKLLLLKVLKPPLSSSPLVASTFTMVLEVNKFIKVALKVFLLIIKVFLAAIRVILPASKDLMVTPARSVSTNNTLVSTAVSHLVSRAKESIKLKAWYMLQ